MIQQLQHCLWLANTILSARRISRADIDRRWAYSSLNDNHESFINERTFHRWRQGAESLLGILIECDRHAGYVYYIPNAEAIRKDQSKRWLLDSLATCEMVQDIQLQPYVLLEEMPSDSQYLTPIMDAIRNRKVMSVTYKSFNDIKEHTFAMEAYCVKSFKRRWYMVGLSSDHPNEVRVYALDRIQSLQIVERSYEIPASFDGRQYFAHSYGIYGGGNTPCRIVIEVTGKSIQYLRTLPLHASQKEIGLGKEKDSIRFEFMLNPTLDFIQELRTFGGQLRVLEPQKLVDEFKKLTKEYKKIYH